LAIVFAKQLGSTIIGLNVFSFPPVITISSDMKNKIKKNSEKIIHQAEEISKKANVSFTGMTKIDDNVGNAIITFAKKYDVDMIIIGSRGPDQELGMFMGSVAHHVVNKSKIPVTVIK